MEKRKTVPIYYMHIVATAKAPTHMKNYLLKLKTGPPSMHCVQERHLIVMLVVMKFVLSLQKHFFSPVIFRNDNSL